MNTNEIAENFRNIGAEFRIEPQLIAQKATQIKAFLFDWDGVFNNGVKGKQIGSPYSEADSMGTNLLRFAYWLHHNQKLPFVGIITGQNNHAAFELAQREHFQAVYYKVNHKTEALKHITDNYGIQPHEVAFCFDDVLDLSAAQEAGLRFLIRRDASPLFLQYVRQNHLADYITGVQGGNFGVREVSELLIGLAFGYDKVVQERVLYGDNYQSYLKARNTPQTVFYTYQNQDLVEQSPF